MTDEKVIELAKGFFFLHHPAEDAEILAFARAIRNETINDVLNCFEPGDWHKDWADKIKGLKS